MLVTLHSTGHYKCYYHDIKDNTLMASSRGDSDFRTLKIGENWQTLSLVPQVAGIVEEKSIQLRPIYSILEDLRIWQMPRKDSTNNTVGVQRFEPKLISVGSFLSSQFDCGPKHSSVRTQECDVLQVTTRSCCTAERCVYFVQPYDLFVTNKKDHDFYSTIPEHRRHVCWTALLDWKPNTNFKYCNTPFGYSPFLGTSVKSAKATCHNTAE